MTNIGNTSNNSLAQARFDAASVNALTLSEFEQSVQESTNTSGLTLYFIDGKEFGSSVVKDARKDCDVEGVLLFFSFSVSDEVSEDSADTIKQCLFLKETYGERWFVSDPKVTAQLNS